MNGELTTFRHCSLCQQHTRHIIRAGHRVAYLCTKCVENKQHYEADRD